MHSPRLIQIVSVAGACVAVGAGAGILGSASAAGPAATPGHHPGKHALGPLRRAVHLEAVVPGPNGQFVTATLDRGVVKSLSGDQLTLVEGTPKAVYKTVTLTIPANAKVRENGQLSQLSAITPGQRAMVFHGPNQTRVGAHDKRVP